MRSWGVSKSQDCHIHATLSYEANTHTPKSPRVGSMSETAKVIQYCTILSLCETGKEKRSWKFKNNSEDHLDLSRYVSDLATFSDAGQPHYP